PARGGGNPGRLAAGAVLHGDLAALASRGDRRLAAGVRAGAGLLPDLGSAGRGQAGDDRQPGAEPVHHRAQLALWLGGELRADGAGAGGGAAHAHAARPGACRMKRRTSWWVILLAGGAYLLLHLPVLVLV